jgi:UDP-N-acetylmuramoyl-L-alanyl-D-glutamate--2,6-diaminopimelate ligase
MELSKLLEGLVVTKLYQTLYGQMVVTHDVQVDKIQYDSRKVGRGDLFVAIRGTGVDGHRFIDQAISAGARVVVLEDDARFPDSYFMHTGTVKVVVPNSRVALAEMSARMYGNPSRRLTMVGVTGTNGKTTTTHLVKAILESSGMKTGLIGTIGYSVGDALMPATHTTPESLELNALLGKMVEHQCGAAVMEVSSHALHQHRVHAIRFAAGVFTNLTQDHLDYHGTLEEYFRAKNILFEGLDEEAVAVVNRDDGRCDEVLRSTKAKTLTFGVSPEADVAATDTTMSLSGTSMKIRYRGTSTSITSPLIGRFNVSNVLAAYATGLSLGIANELLVKAVAGTRAVQGRFEHVASPHGWTAVIDYAHTPDALQKALAAVRDIFEPERQGRIITVFGCGGDRDRTKRPIMGRIAAGLSDLTIVTSDNPRHEDPEAIIGEVMAGVPAGAAAERVADRESAILKALASARPNDVVLIAGKGHEDYQVIGDRRVHFSDREVVDRFIREHP